MPAPRQLALALLFAATLHAQVAATVVLMPAGLAYDGSGNLYFADAARHQVFESTLGGSLRLIAGTGTQGYAGDGGLATAAQLNTPQALAIAPDGTLYIADTGNHAIRAVTNGTITTVAGTGQQGFSGDNGPATAAQLASPNALAFDATGALLLCDSANHRIRRISAGGNVTASGIITTLAGTGVQGFAGDNGPALAAQLDTPSGLAVANGTVYVADTHNHRVRAINAAGMITTVAGTGQPGFSGDNGPATAAQLDSPRGLAITPGGALLIADANNQRLRSVSSAGLITTLAGGPTQGNTTDGTAALAAALNTPRAVGISSFGYPVFADAPNRTLRILAADGNLYAPAALAPARASTMTLTANSSATVTVRGIATPQGNVQLILDGSPGPIATLANAAATFPLAALAPGSHTLAASYLGDGLNPAATSAALTFAAGKAVSAVVTQPPSPNDYAGMPLLLNANVTSTTSGTPTGTVAFLDATAANATLATAQLAAGIASAVYLAPTAGTHSVVASYLGDASFAPSAAPAVTVIVKPMPDFALAANGSTTQTVAAGAIASYTLAITPQNGPFTGAVSLAVSGLPSGATASFTPPQVVPDASPATATLSVQTLALPIAQAHAPAVVQAHAVALYALLLLPFLVYRRRPRPRILALLPLALFLSACGNRVNQPPTPAAGVYTLTVSATGTNLAGALAVHTTTVTLKVE